MGKGELWLEKFAQFSDTDLFIHLLSWISPPTLCMKSWTHKQRPARERTLDTIDLMQPTKTDIGWIWGCSSVKFLNKLILPPISYFNKTRSRYKIPFHFPHTIQRSDYHVLPVNCDNWCYETNLYLSGLYDKLYLIHPNKS